MIVYALGEGVVDFIMNEHDGDDDYKMQAGGAALNIACLTAKKLGEMGVNVFSAPVMRVGSDDLGQFLIDTALNYGCSTRFIFQGEVPTTRLYLRINKEGKSECGGRESGADLELSPEDVGGITFNSTDVLYITSNGFLSPKSADAHKLAVKNAIEAGAKICFDINLRLGLWDKDMTKPLLPYIKTADILKIKERELAFFFTSKDYAANVKKLLKMSKKGADIYITKQDLTMQYYSGGKLVKEEKPEIIDDVQGFGRGDRFLAEIICDLFK